MATTPTMKITYSTLSADNEELQSAFEEALQRARGDLGRTYPMLIGGEERLADETFDDRSPIDRDMVVARFPVGGRQDVRDAVAAARAAYPAWRDTPWRDRLAILRRAADLISQRQFDYAALMTLEVGKNRLESLGDVEETADLLRRTFRTANRATLPLSTTGSGGMEAAGDGTGGARLVARVLGPSGLVVNEMTFEDPLAFTRWQRSEAPLAENRQRLEQQLAVRVEVETELNGARRSVVRERQRSAVPDSSPDAEQNRGYAERVSRDHGERDRPFRQHW